MTGEIAEPKGDEEQACGSTPAIILVDPQLGFNIGACARAMLNCGLTDLRLVRPRDGWPNTEARNAATSAVSVVDGARVFERTEDAIADLQLVFATTGRGRDLAKPVVGPVVAAEQLREATASGATCGVLFGPERTGLENPDLVLATRVLEVPLSDACKSLNLAQAVMLVAWEWHRSGLSESVLFENEGPAFEVEGVGTRPLERAVHPRRRRLERRTAALEEPATAGELIQLFEHLEQELDTARFFRVPEKRDGMILNLRAHLSRAIPTRQEVKTFHGVVTALSGRRKDGQPHRQEGSRVPREAKE